MVSATPELPEVDVLFPIMTLTGGIFVFVVSNFAISAASNNGYCNLTYDIYARSSCLVYSIICMLPLTCPSRALAVVATKFWRECLSRFLNNGESL